MDRPRFLKRPDAQTTLAAGVTYVRRKFLLVLASPLVPEASRPSPGDWVRVVSMPREDWESAPRAELRAVGRKFRLSLGKRCRVIDVEESGRVEVDVWEHVRHEFPHLIGCSLMYEPDCLCRARSVGGTPVSRSNDVLHA